MTTLVTGAAGFLGSAVARRLIESGHTVRALVRPSSARRNLEGLRLELVEGDLKDRRTLDRAAAGCEAVFHVAADYRLWAPEPEPLYENNVTGTRNLMLAAGEAGARRVVYTSSVATLGLNRDGSPADERTPVTLMEMIGHYKRSKFLAEAEVLRLAAEEKLPVVIVNPSTPVGPRDLKPTPTGRMVLDAARGAMPAYVDTGLNIVHVDDCAAGHCLALERGQVGGRYILGGHDMTLHEILKEIAAITGGRRPWLRLPHALLLPIACLNEGWARLTGTGEPRATLDGVRMSRKKMFFSSAKAQRELGYSFRPATDAFCDAIAWFRDNGYF
jgi:dihydroflavonol-4-reductase